MTDGEPCKGRGNGRYAWIQLISSFLGTCIRITIGFFTKTLSTRRFGSEGKAEKTRLLEPASDFDEPQSDSACYQRETDQRKLSLVFGESLPVPFASIQHAFRFQAHNCRNFPAVEHLGNLITYGQLDLLSTLLAQRLCSSRADEGTRVLLLSHRSIPFIIGIIGALKAGASYIPLDGGIVTDETLHSIIKDAGPSVLLCLRKYAKRVVRCDVSTLVIEDILESSSPVANVNTEIKAKWKPENEAYVIYTSGTTGRPKGVSVSHANVTNRLSFSKLS